MRRVSRRHLVLGLMLVGAIAYLIFAVRTTSGSAREGAPARSAGADRDKGARKKENLRLPEPVDFARYQETIARNIFGPPAPPKPPEGQKIPPPPPLQGPSAPPAAPRPKPPDLSGWSYTGYMVIGDQLIGVLQNEANDSMKELTVGSEFMGATVKSIGPDEIVFTSPGGEVPLSTPRDFPVVSLSRTSAGTPTRPMQPPVSQPTPPPMQPPQRPPEPEPE